MTAKTHYAIYALLGVIILLLLFFIISASRSHQSEVQSLQSQLDEINSLSDDEAIEMVQRFAIDTCDEPQRYWYKRLNSNGSKWFVHVRTNDYIRVVNKIEDRYIPWNTTYDFPTLTYEINLKTKQVSRYSSYARRSYGGEWETAKIFKC
tara:strand:+ start:71 stop:520 length:450 start_codon:yes stop_codon:yes gene_type:complete